MKCIDRISRHIPSRRFEGHDAPFRYLVDLGDVRKDDQPQAISGLPAANPHPLDRRQRERGGGLTSTIECRDSSALPEDALPEPPDGPASDRRCQRKDQILPIPEDRRHQERQNYKRKKGHLHGYPLALQENSHPWTGHRNRLIIHAHLDAAPKTDPVRYEYASNSLFSSAIVQ